MLARFKKFPHDIWLEYLYIYIYISNNKSDRSIQYVPSFPVRVCMCTEYLHWEIFSWKLGFPEFYAFPRVSIFSFYFESIYEIRSWSEDSSVQYLPSALARNIDHNTSLKYKFASLTKNKRNIETIVQEEYIFPFSLLPVVVELGNFYSRIVSRLPDMQMAPPAFIVSKKYVARYEYVKWQVKQNEKKGKNVIVVRENVMKKKAWLLVWKKCVIFQGTSYSVFLSFFIFTL